LYLTNKRLVYVSELSAPQREIEIPLHAIRTVQQAQLGPLKLNQVIVVYSINGEKTFIFQPVLTGRSTILEGALSDEWVQQIRKTAKLDVKKKPKHA
jgi:ABC-type bacteriocin/lantibiotic exporter with double-glycine peptidase domain